MQKDVIYIDTEDDITTIIGKLKDTKKEIVALVPPKRIGVLQSAVNLRILQRAAKSSKRQLVVITNDSSLKMLAASVGIPVAKSLQTKPELAEIPALKVDDEDDIIDGSELPVGEHADGARPKKEKATPASSKLGAAGAASSVVKKSASKNNDAPAKKQQKIPNFSKFRKRLFIGIILLCLLIGFIIWAVVYAPRATISMKAKTSKESVSSSVTLALDAPESVDAKKGVLGAKKVSKEDTLSVEFTPTGKKVEREAASGTVTLSRSRRGSVDVPTGSGFSIGDCTYTTTSEVEVPGASLNWVGGLPGSTPGTAEVNVKATEPGEECNVSAQSMQSTIKGLDASGSDMTGGKNREYTVVTNQDVQEASGKMKQKTEDAMKQELLKKAGNNFVEVMGSFKVDKSSPRSEPAVDEEVSGDKAKLTMKVKYSLVLVDSVDVKEYLQAALTEKTSKDTLQKVYDSGIDSVSFSDFAMSEDVATVTLGATGEIGPSVEEEEIKDRSKGKKLGDIQSDLQSINGISDVDVEFWPFWVSTVPSKDEKISVKFNLEQHGKE